jgi:hypothetical protein
MAIALFAPWPHSPVHLVGSSGEEPAAGRRGGHQSGRILGQLLQSKSVLT